MTSSTQTSASNKPVVADEYSAASFTISTSRLDSEHALVSAPINPALQRVKAGAHEERSRSRNNSDMSEFDDVRASGTSGGGITGGGGKNKGVRNMKLRFLKDTPIGFALADALLDVLCPIIT